MQAQVVGANTDLLAVAVTVSTLRVCGDRGPWLWAPRPEPPLIVSKAEISPVERHLTTYLTSTPQNRPGHNSRASLGNGHSPEGPPYLSCGVLGGTLGRKTSVKTKEV